MMSPKATTWRQWRHRLNVSISRVGRVFSAAILTVGCQWLCCQNVVSSRVGSVGVRRPDQTGRVIITQTLRGSPGHSSQPALWPAACPVRAARCALPIQTSRYSLSSPRYMTVTSAHYPVLNSTFVTCFIPTQHTILGQLNWILHSALLII